MNNQREMFVEFPAAVTPAPDSDWKTFSEDGGGITYRQAGGNVIEICMDGEISTAIRKSGDRYSHPLLLPQRPRGFRNFVSRLAMVRQAKHEMVRAAEARERADVAIEAVFAAAEDDARPKNTRCGNKLARAANDEWTDDSKLHFFNPKQLLGALLFSPVPSILRKIPDITLAEQLV